MGERRLIEKFGNGGAKLWALSHGRDHRPVLRGSGARSISHEQTFGTDLQERAAVRAVLLRQVEAVARRLRRAGVKARTITLKIRFGDYRTITRSRTLPVPTDVTDRLWDEASAVFESWARDGFEPVRLIGFGASHLDDRDDPTLFETGGDSRSRAVDAATDAIRDRFGARSVFRGSGGLKRS